MNGEQLLKKYEKLFRDIEGVEIERFEQINSKPHVYAAGRDHMRFAFQKYKSKITERSILMGEIAGIRCAVPGCDLAFAQHTYEFCCFCKLTKEATGEDLADKMESTFKKLERNSIFKEFENDKVVRLGFNTEDFNLI